MLCSIEKLLVIFWMLLFSGKLSLIFFVEKNLMRSLRGLISWKQPRLHLKRRSLPMNITRSTGKLAHMVFYFKNCSLCDNVIDLFLCKLVQVSFNQIEMKSHVWNYYKSSSWKLAQFNCHPCIISGELSASMHHIIWLFIDVLARLG